MTRVILSPTWKLIPDTVSWPEKPKDAGYGDLNLSSYSHRLTEASRHLVDIAEEDWGEVNDSVRFEVKDRDFEGQRFVYPDTPYTIDDEFEVDWQRNMRLKKGRKDKWVDWDDHEYRNRTSDIYQYRQIARLVKPKENYTCPECGVKEGEQHKNDCKYPRPDYVAMFSDSSLFKKYTLLNPSDSVTSDGTTIKVDNRPRFTWASKARMREWTDGERRDAINYLHELNGQPMTKEPTETQDELWLKFKLNVEINGWDFTTKRFRIERI